MTSLKIQLLNFATRLLSPVRIEPNACRDADLLAQFLVGDGSIADEFRLANQRPFEPPLPHQVRSNSEIHRRSQQRCKCQNNQQRPESVAHDRILSLRPKIDLAANCT